MRGWESLERPGNCEENNGRYQNAQRGVNDEAIAAQEIGLKVVFGDQETKVDRR